MRGPGPSCRCLEPFPRKASALQGSSAAWPTFLLLTLPPQPPRSLHPGFPAAADNVPIHHSRGKKEGCGEPSTQLPSCRGCLGPSGLHLHIVGLFEGVCESPNGFGGSGRAGGRINFVQVSLGHEGCGVLLSHFFRLPAPGRGHKERMGGGGSSPVSSLFPYV